MILNLLGAIIGVCLFGLLMYIFTIVFVFTFYGYSLKDFIKEYLNRRYK